MAATALVLLLLLQAVAVASQTPLLVAQVPVDVAGEAAPVLREFRLQQGDEPVDELEEFRLRHGQSREWRHTMLVQLCRQPEVVCRRQVPVVFSTAVTAPNGASLGQFELLEGIEPYDAVLTFGLTHDLDRDARLSILEAVCRRPHITCTRNTALVYKQSIRGEGGKLLGDLEVFDDQEPVDQIYSFICDKQLPMTAMGQLLAAVCESPSVQCRRRDPTVFSERITVSGGADGEPPRSLGVLQILFNEEPVDVVHAFAQNFGLAKTFQRNLLNHVCGSAHVTCKRRAAVVFQAPITVENGSVVGEFRIHEDEELADATFKFARRNNISTELRAALFQTLCGREDILCTRGQALLRSLPVDMGESQLLGVIEVFEGQEPADVVYQFAERHGLSPHNCDVLLDILCGTTRERPSPPQDEDESEPLMCNRYAPVVFSVPVAGKNGSHIGVLEVLGNEEPADAIARFGNKHELGADEKHSILSAVCEASGLPCTRSTGLMYQAVYTLPNGQRERLDFFDGQESTDVIYDYGLMRNLTLRERKTFLIEVCSDLRRRPNCTRAEPLLLSIPVWESADKKLGDVEVHEGQEPVDVVYAFMEKHDLFQTEPLNTTLVPLVCNNTRVTCTRMQPRRVLFSMQATYHGIPHTIEYVKPESDWVCEPQQHGGQKCVHNMEIQARDFCRIHMFDWLGCEARILEALHAQLEAYDDYIWRSKNHYAKLGLVRSASRAEIDAAYNTLVKRYNNESEPHKYAKLQDAYRVLSDPEEKYFYDMPCVKLFGCLCGKRQRDGGITFTPD